MRPQPPRRAASRARMRGMSTMEVSSTMTASTARGSSSPWAKTSSPVCWSNWVSSRRWMVLASQPVASVMRLAARPVGAARRISMPSISK